jgi:hypothetical protein
MKMTALGERASDWFMMASMWLMAFGKWRLVEGPGSRERRGSKRGEIDRRLPREHTWGLIWDEDIDGERCISGHFLPRETPNDHNELANVAQVLGKEVSNEGFARSRSSEDVQGNLRTGGVDERLQFQEEIQACRPEVDRRGRAGARKGKRGT